MAEALAPSGHSGRITWLGRVGDRDAGLASAGVQMLVLDWDGAAGEAHSGRTRPACARVRDVHPKGTEIANTRQLTLLSAEELAAIAAEMGVDRLDPGWIGASLVLEGIADFSHVPPSSRLRGPSGATLVIDMENLPCTLSGREVERHLPGHGRALKPAAMDRRGVTAWVERPGMLRLGDVLELFVPTQRGWLP
jgi:hypothetical protein